MSSNATVIELAYLLSAVLFIVGLKGLSHPRTAVRGNMLGALGMLLAIVTTLLAQDILNPTLIIIGLSVGSVVGALLAMTIQMTAMPQLVGLFNGFGGIASILVAGAVLYQVLSGSAAGASAAGASASGASASGVAAAGGIQFLIATAASGLIGAVTFFGSLIAFGKLQGLVTEKPLRYPGEQIVKILVAAASLAAAVLVVLSPTTTEYYWILAGVASLLGILLVIPIGGADMPIVIALLNSYSGLAAAATGFVLNNTVLIIAGSLVGASGIILTNIMCKAMNRTLANVLF
ncbi:MAG: NAD(P)(+) transhydrogenase (Re/Si-specific) subunit beta, partial [Alkalispirochaeta sp.]